MFDVTSFVMGKAAGGGGGGGGDEPKLPDDYQEVAYIGFTPTAGYLVDIPSFGVYKITIIPSDNVSTYDRCFLGYRNASTNAGDFEFYIVAKTQNADVFYRTSSYIVASDGAKPLTPCEKNTYEAIINYSSGTRRAYIGMYASYSSSSYFGFDGKVCGIKTYAFYGGLTSKFIPCYRTSDGVVGFYEAVSGTFYSEVFTAGSGAIEKGPDVN